MLTDVDLVQSISFTRSSSSIDRWQSGERSCLACMDDVLVYIRTGNYSTPTFTISFIAIVKPTPPRRSPKLYIHRLTLPSSHPYLPPSTRGLLLQHFMCNHQSDTLAAWVGVHDSQPIHPPFDPPPPFPPHTTPPLHRTRTPADLTPSS